MAKYKITVTKSYTVEAESVDEIFDCKVEDVFEEIKEDIGQFLHDCDLDIERLD